MPVFIWWNFSIGYDFMITSKIEIKKMTVKLEPLLIFEMIKVL